MSAHIEPCDLCRCLPALYAGLCWRCNEVRHPSKGVEPGDSHDHTAKRPMPNGNTDNVAHQ